MEGSPAWVLFNNNFTIVCLSGLFLYDNILIACFCLTISWNIFSFYLCSSVISGCSITCYRFGVYTTSMLRTCPNMTLAVERDVKPQL